jgi:hypothetical protein
MLGDIPPPADNDDANADPLDLLRNCIPTLAPICQWNRRRSDRIQKVRYYDRKDKKHSIGLQLPRCSLNENSVLYMRLGIP